MIKEAFDLFSLSSYCPASAFYLAVLLSIPQVIDFKIDYIKALKCYLIAMISGYPIAKLTIDQFKSCKIKAFGESVTHIEKKFIAITNQHEQSKTNVLLTPVDIFSKMKNEFDDLSHIEIIADSLTRNPEMRLYDHINLSYAHCLLSSNNRFHLTRSLDEFTLLNIIQKRNTRNYQKICFDKTFVNLHVNGANQ